MELPVLYSFRRCPYAIRARLAIAYSQINVELREVVLKDKPAELLELSPKATVPVLLTPEGRVIEESLEIMQWALELNDPLDWFQNLSLQQGKFGKELIDDNDRSFKHFLDRYKYFERYPEESQNYYRTHCEDYLAKLELLLNEHQYLLGNTNSWADMAILPFIRQFAFVDKNWFDQCEYNKVKNWLNDFLSSELFVKVMSKYPQWQAPEDGVIFPESNG